MIWPVIRRIIAAGFAFGVALLVVGWVVLMAIGMHWAAQEVASYAPQNADEFERVSTRYARRDGFRGNHRTGLDTCPRAHRRNRGRDRAYPLSPYYVCAGGAAAVAMRLLSPPAQDHSPVYAVPYFGHHGDGRICWRAHLLGDRRTARMITLAQ